MKVIQRLDIDDFEDQEYALIAISTTLEDYRLAFEVNKKCKLQLSRFSSDLTLLFNGNEVGFSHYGFEDFTQDMYWSLIQNSRWITLDESQFGLFDQDHQRAYLFPELKNVDYFLKIEGAFFNDPQLEELLVSLKEITNVSTAFKVDLNKIKSKDNLIF